MKLNAVGVSSKNIPNSVKFYELLGFKFPELTGDEQHLEAVQEGSAKLMIDTVVVVKEIIEEEPRPGNHAGFAIQYDSANEVNEIARKVEKAGFSVVKQPWDAFWGQRYAVVEDPDGYKVDLYAGLPK